jgi:hypothetical protein
LKVVLPLGFGKIAGKIIVLGNGGVEKLARKRDKGRIANAASGANSWVHISLRIFPTDTRSLEHTLLMGFPL